MESIATRGPSLRAGMPNKELAAWLARNEQKLLANPELRVNEPAPLAKVEPEPKELEVSRKSSESNSPPVESPETVVARPHPYQGVKDASAYLKSKGVPRPFRKQVLESFEVETIKVRPATINEYGLRYYDDINAKAEGRYLFETFPATRENLALKTEWNQMTKIAQFKVIPDTPIIEGKASAQGLGLSGGQTQKYILNLPDLIRQ